MFCACENSYSNLYRLEPAWITSNIDRDYINENDHDNAI